MNRWNLRTKTRVARKRRESKNINVKYKDNVKRNFNPKQDNIVATDVSYIPANVIQNNVYLSVAISHKTKLVEAWKLSSSNDTSLVIRTLKDLKRKKKFILHSDHCSQYSTSEAQTLLKEIKCKTSMGRVGNSLDNREFEYFFSCLKSEHLNHLPKYKMSLKEIESEIRWYINWYNKNRIQKRL